MTDLVYVIYWSLRCGKNIDDGTDIGAHPHAVSSRCYESYEEAQCAARGGDYPEYAREIASVHRLRHDAWMHVYRTCRALGATR